MSNSDLHRLLGLGLLLRLLGPPGERRGHADAAAVVAEEELVLAVGTVWGDLVSPPGLVGHPPRCGAIVLAEAARHQAAVDTGPDK